MKKYIFLLIAITTILYSCQNEKDEISPLALFVRPSQESNIQVMNAGEYKVFTLKFYTTNLPPEIIRISAFNNTSGERILLDSTFSTKCDSLRYIYQAPELNNDSVKETIIFFTKNQESDATAERSVIIKRQTLLLNENTGIVLRNQDYNFDNAFRFINPTQTFCVKNSPDSTLADLYMKSTENFDTVSIFSRTNAKFVRYNNFNYSSASALSIQNVFSSSNRQDNITNLQINDIIICGHDVTAEGVAFVTNIIRNGSNSEQCVQLSFKTIK